MVNTIPHCKLSVDSSFIKLSWFCHVFVRALIQSAKSPSFCVLYWRCWHLWVNLPHLTVLLMVWRRGIVDMEEERTYLFLFQNLLISFLQHGLHHSSQFPFLEIFYMPCATPTPVHGSPELSRGSWASCLYFFLVQFLPWASCSPPCSLLKARLLCYHVFPFIYFHPSNATYLIIY